LVLGIREGYQVSSQIFQTLYGYKKGEVDYAEDFVEKVTASAGDKDRDVALQKI
jgi:hypothetical protein